MAEYRYKNTEDADDEYVNQAMERMTSMEPYYCNPFDNPKELKERASELPKRRKMIFMLENIQ